MKKIFFLIIIFISLYQTTKEDDNYTLLKDIDFEKEDKEQNITNKDEEKKIIIEDDNIYLMNSTKDFDLNIKINGTSKNTLIILFYSDSCIHCLHFQPIYKNVSKILKNNTNIKFSKIQLSSSRQILKKYKQLKVPGVPTVYIYKNGNFIRYEGEREPEKIISYIYKFHTFYCTEIFNITELSKFINHKTLFSLDKQNQFILGLFKNKENNKIIDKSFILNNFLELNTLNNDLLLNKKCYYYFYNLTNEKNNNINDINYYLNNILYNDNNDDENNNYLIYAYNYQKGLNTFPLFNTYLNFQNNSTKLNDYNNLNKHIKIIQNKYKLFIEDYYLYKYYYINDTDELNNYYHHNKKFFIFDFKSEGIHKLFVNEINYILSLNSSLNKDYLFVLCNITNNKKLSKKEGISFFDIEYFSPTQILDENGLNKTNIQYKIFEYIYRDQKNLLESELDYSDNFLLNTFNSVYKWFLNLTNDENKTHDTNINIAEQNIQEKIENISNIDYEQELIDEINKTIIEENEKNKEINKNEKNINENNLKYIKKSNNNYYEFNEDEEMGFNKNLILFPFYLIIYSIIYFFFYKYILLKYQDKIFYSRLPTEDPKNK